LTATPSTLACGVNRARITAELENLGDSREDVQLFLRNTATSFEKNLNNAEDLRLDNDYTDESAFKQTIDESVTLTDLKAGTNTYTLVAYYADNLNVQKDVTITSQSCTPTPSIPNIPGAPTTPTTDNNVVPTTPNVPSTPSVPSTTPVSNPSYVTLKDVSGFGIDSDLVLPVAIGIGGLVVGVIVALLLIPRP
jgi:hypothetical protein